MAMTAGTVTVDGEGEPSGSGLARDFYDDECTAIEAMNGLIPDSVRIAMLQDLATKCNNRAARIITHITANGEVTVKVDNTDSGLQKSTAAGNPTDPHDGGPITLATKGTIE